jgi:hypothetical protein
MVLCKIGWGVHQSDNWTDDVSDNAEYINELLQEILKDDSTTGIEIEGSMAGVRYDRLHDVLVTSRYVSLFRAEWFAVSVLCDALEHRDCQITDILLSIAPGHGFNAPRLSRAFKDNKSLRVVRRVDLEVMRSVTHSTTVETLWPTLARGELCPEDLRAMVAMPALCDIRSCNADFMRAAFRASRVEWPDSVCPVFGVLLRSPNVLRHHSRQILRALYECAGRVLPDHVIHDIAAEVRLQVY